MANVESWVTLRDIWAADRDAGKIATFDPTIASPTAPATGTLSGFILPSNYTGELPQDVVKSSHPGLWGTDYSDVSPRIGFAAQLQSRPMILLRGGYGIYYDR